jgi:hypothetical protein
MMMKEVRREYCSGITLECLQEPHRRRKGIEAARALHRSTQTVANQRGRKNNTDLFQLIFYVFVSVMTSLESKLMMKEVRRERDEIEARLSAVL